jgi:anhydro-N-acetylmuramic acid kinase
MASSKEKNGRLTIVGLMSGSSLDGLDIACCEFELDETQATGNPVRHWQLIDAETAPFSADWRRELKELPGKSARELALAHSRFGAYVGQLVSAFLQSRHIDPDLIASHGHTIFHFPDQGCTFQLGDGAAIAAATGFLVIDNFRAMDVALGGQGAPIAPIADRMLFPGYDFFLNLGGIANVTCNANGRYIAFDIGGANQVLNALVAPLGIEYDKDGTLAARGKLNKELLERANRLDYFRQSYPKSLGNDWVQEQLLPIYLEFESPLEDKLFTACAQLARQTARDLQDVLRRENIPARSYRLLATGGGAFNPFLIKQIREECRKVATLEVVIPDARIISFKEAVLMALMGALRLANIPNCMASVTGAWRDAIGGAVHQGHSQ